MSFVISAPSPLPDGDRIRQNHTHVISAGRSRGAPLHPVAGAGPLPGARPGDLLPREGGLLARSQARVRGVSGPDRVPQLRTPSGRAVRRVGGHERTRATTPEADGLIAFGVTDLAGRR